MAADNRTYERSAIGRWLQEHRKSPVTGLQLADKSLRTNWAMRDTLGAAGYFVVSGVAEVEGVGHGMPQPALLAKPAAAAIPHQVAAPARDVQTVAEAPTVIARLKWANDICTAYAASIAPVRRRAVKRCRKAA